MEEVERSCGECLYWEALQDGDEDDKGRVIRRHRLKGIGECRRYAPAPKISKSAVFVVAWPETYGKDWCGEFSPSSPLVD